MPNLSSFVRTLRLVKAGIGGSQALKLSFSLALLVLCVLFVADVLSLRGNTLLERQKGRSVVAESLAVQLSTLASLTEVAALQHAVSEFVNRNDDVLGAALYPASGEMIANSGQMPTERAVDGVSTINDMIVPLYEGERVWGEVRVAFQPKNKWKEDAGYFAFLAASCILVFTGFLSRVLLQLDPSRAVPGRVNSAFNLFTEGVVIMDDQMRILLTNNSASAMINTSPESQVGKLLDDWPWVRDENWYSPWRDALHAGMGAGPSEHHLYLDEPDGQRLVVVSCTLVGDQEEDRTGVMVTLNDMSVLQKKNYELQATSYRLRCCNWRNHVRPLQIKT